MRFKLKVIFHEKQYIILAKKSIFPIFPKMFKRNSWIYWLIPEDSISNMGAACKDSASHYLQLKIKKIKPIIKKPVFGIFGKTSVELEIDANVNSVSKKIKGAQFCQKN